LLISRAWHFAAQRHSSQRRKGKAQEPYVNHLAEVADLVATATEGQDANLVVAAVLHDTVEDTATLPAELATIFNAEIADLVVEVTDDKSLEKEVRKKLQLDHAALRHIGQLSTIKLVRPQGCEDLAQMAVATREPVPMGSVQQPPDAAPSASSSDRPPPHRCERISPVKNRMLEIGTSKTVRGEDGNILTYSALRLKW
jgi:hypothetical protein